MIYYWSPIHGYGEKFKHERELVHKREREREAKLAREREDKHEQKSEHQGNKDLL